MTRILLIGSPSVSKSECHFYWGGATLAIAPFILWAFYCFTERDDRPKFFGYFSWNINLTLTQYNVHSTVVCE